MDPDRVPVARTIIGLAGRAGAGKSTVAFHLMNEHNFRRVRFAGPLKDMMRALGLSEREVDGDLKGEPCKLLGGKTPRWAMQSLGTEWGRNLICDDLWIRAWRAAVDSVPMGVPIVADDVRFPNEVAAIRNAAAFSMIVRLERPDQAPEARHVSELQAFSVDATWRNDGTVADLLGRVDAELISTKAAQNASPSLRT